MLLTFSDMLRYQLYECNESLISIDKELDYIRNYVSLQKVRKNDLLKVSVEIADDVKGFRISPLLFIAFIENSFKYAGGGDDDGEFVCISFTRGNGSLHFTCKNSKGAISVNTEGHNGIGISNAKRRLGLLYPSRHSLAINDEGGTFEVNLKIDIDETELHYS
jgi:LytS/YehU family sensor histidine kinase